MALSRRKFLQLGSLASASLMVPEFLKGFEFAPLAAQGNKVLVVVQLTGGNDGLNTVVPYRNDVYYRARPQLGIPRDQAIALTDDLGLNPSLKAVRQLYDDGKACIINGIGYEHPNRSHFRSMDIWHTGSRSDEIVTTGWLGRYLDMDRSDYNMHNSMAIEVDESLSLAIRGEQKNAIAVKDVDQFYNVAANGFFKKLASHNDEHQARLARYLYKTLREATSAADYIYARSKIYKSAVSYPDTAIANRLKTIGSLIISNAETRVYYVSQGSFDTHAAQKGRQQELLSQLDGALSALVSDLKANNRFDDVLIMTFSEFGRRLSQNASLGTDHGTAGTMFLISGSLKKAGLYNDIPSLTDLDDGDLKYEVDFKNVYATILDNWLDANSKHILGRKYDHLSFI